MSRNVRANTKSGKRYSARYLVLTYSQTSEDFQPLRLLPILDNEQARSIIARKSDEDGGTCYYAFVDFRRKRFHTRNKHLFDIQGVHPNWACPENPGRSWNYVGDMEDVVHHKCPRPIGSSSQRRARTSEPSAPASSVNSDERFTARGPVAELIDWLDGFKAALEVLVYKDGVDTKEMTNERLTRQATIVIRACSELARMADLRKTSAGRI